MFGDENERKQKSYCLFCTVDAAQKVFFVNQSTGLVDRAIAVSSTSTKSNSD
ncbi:MAG TPA: hypothetical protein V6C85_34695 [Allocoleopsis sp.]